MAGVLERLAKTGKAYYGLKKTAPALQRTPDVLTEDVLARLGLALERDVSSLSVNPYARALRVKSKRLDADPDQAVTIEQLNPEELLMELRGYGSSHLGPKERSYASGVERILNRVGKPTVSEIEATMVAPGLGAPSYRAAYGLPEAQAMGPNVATSLTPINERRRTANMLSQWLHDPLAGEQVVLHADQPAKAYPLDPWAFYQMSPEEQLGWLAATELERFKQDLPRAASSLLDPTKGLSDQMVDQIVAAAAKHQTKVSPYAYRDSTRAWGPTTLRRALLTDRLLSGQTVEELQPSPRFLEGLGGYRTGGLVKRHPR